MQEGFNEMESRPGKNGLPIGTRIHRLLDADATLAPGGLKEWTPGDAPLDGWAPGWYPINKQTVQLGDVTMTHDGDGEELAHYNPLCTALKDKMEVSMATDYEGMRDGIRLPEAQSHASPYMSFSDIIRVYNASLGGLRM